MSDDGAVRPDLRAALVSDLDAGFADVLTMIESAVPGLVQWVRDNS